MRARASIGERRRRFMLELPVDIPDGFGGVVTTYHAGPQIWGAMEFLSVAERILADVPGGLATHRLTFAWREGVTSAMRLVLGPRRFRIRHAGDPDGARRSLVCLVEEMAA